MANTMKDVTVVIDIQKPVGRLGFGKVLILGEKAGGFAYKEYLDLTSVRTDFPETTEEYKAASAIFAQGDQAPASIAITCRNSTIGEGAETLVERLQQVMDKDWYFLISTSAAKTDVLALADEIELDGTHQYFTRSSNQTDLAAIKAKKYTRTSVLYHTNLANYPDAAWVGATGSAPVGSVTWKFKQLRGIEPLELSATELLAIHGLGANAYVTKAGDNVTTEGKVVDDEYIDIIHAKDYVKFSIEYSIQKLLNSTPKIPYTAAGISQIEGAVRTVLQRAHNQGIIASDSDGIGLYGTTFKSRDEVDPADRAERTYNDGSFFFELAGAVHAARINGVIRY
ncbi:MULTISPECIES: DUF3383 family protein [Paenibacillus]|uniref:DUF3383 family protein n=1 Tax=Paenibacillus TaxID=44249 RepID=UPI00280BC54D|nr:DUF3383 family protein [Paenibacillus radicis (ex Xue et al. 2023)]